MFHSVRARILLALAALVGLLAVTSVIAVREVARLEELSRQVAAIDEVTHRLHRVATAMRDAYAHQAHTAILNDRSHLDHYHQTQKAALDALADVRLVIASEDRAAFEGIARVVADLDASFQKDLLPNIPGPGGAAVAEAHHQAMHLVENGQKQADELVSRLHARAIEIDGAVQAVRDRLVARCGALFAFALFFAVAVALVVDRRVVKPLHDLEIAARRLGGGDPATRVAVVGDDEVASLGRHWNEMATSLQERQRQLLEAERLAGVGRLAAGVAHEINNPLSVMLGYVRLVEKRLDEANAANAAPAAADESRADLTMVRAEIKRCQEIVAGLLDLARPPRLAASEVDVTSLVKDAAAPLSPLPDGSPRVRLTANDGGVVVVGDEGKLMQVLRNLLQNAVEAAPAAAIDVAVFVDADNVIVDVHDAGAGLSDEARRRLFEPFFTSKESGTGLGLAVSRAFVVAHNGSLECLEPGRDEKAGATFRLRLPRPAAASAHKAAA